MHDGLPLTSSDITGCSGKAKPVCRLHSDKSMPSSWAWWQALIYTPVRPANSMKG
jgi:hypothetical protein